MNTEDLKNTAANETQKVSRQRLPVWGIVLTSLAGLIFLFELLLQIINGAVVFRTHMIILSSIGLLSVILIHTRRRAGLVGILLTALYAIIFAVCAYFSYYIYLGHDVLIFYGIPALWLLITGVILVMPAIRAIFRATFSAVKRLSQINQILLLVLLLFLLITWLLFPLIILALIYCYIKAIFMDSNDKEKSLNL